MTPGHGPAVWDPAQYGRFGAERARPFGELVSRIPVRTPAHVADLGCGSGELTLLLARRWPDATIDAIDTSPEMIAAAISRHDIDEHPAPDNRTDPPDTAHDDGVSTPDAAGDEPHTRTGARIRFSVGDVRTWRPARPMDVIISNAVLHWVPGHEDLLVRWVGDLTPGGCLAFQVPGNHDEPSHTLLRELCRSARWRDRLADVLPRRPVRDAAGYLEPLTALGCAVDAWETTYLQILPGQDPVLEWVKGTTLRPVLSVLDDGEAQEFLTEYGARLREAYPPGPHGTVFPFRRIFVVARRPDDGPGSASGGPAPALSRAGPAP